MTKKISCGILNDLDQSLPHIASLLSKTALPGKIGNLILIHGEDLPRNYMSDDSCRDKLLSKHGLLETLPFVLSKSTDEGDGKVPGWGVSLYQCRDLEIKYAVFASVDNYFRQVPIYVLLKDTEEAFRKHVHAQDAKANRITKPPILKDGMLEKIIDSTIGYLDRKEKIEKYGVRIVRGVLLEGEPGNGKTMLCRWIRKLCIDKEISYGQVTAGEIENWHNNGSRLHNLFNNYSVVFFDDFDLDKLQGNMGRDIISALDGLEDTSHRIRIFTTNQKISREMDPAFFRPGRVDERFHFTNPDEEMRRRLVDFVWPKEIREWINHPGRMKVFLDKSSGFSFADLEAIRKNMVFEFDVSGEWKQDEAFARFKECQVDSRRKVGFSTI